MGRYKFHDSSSSKFWKGFAAITVSARIRKGTKSSQVIQSSLLNLTVLVNTRPGEEEKGKNIITPHHAGAG